MAFTELISKVKSLLHLNSSLSKLFVEVYVVQKEKAKHHGIFLALIFVVAVAVTGIVVFTGSGYSPQNMIAGELANGGSSEGYCKCNAPSGMKSLMDMAVVMIILHVEDSVGQTNLQVKCG